jgi:hypothetical protein
MWRHPSRWRAVLLVLLATAATSAPWLIHQKVAFGRAGFHLQKADYVMNIARADTALYGARSVPSNVVITDSAQVQLGSAGGSATGILRRELGFFLASPLAYMTDYAREFLHFFQPLPDRVTSRNRFNQPAVKWLGAIHFGPLLVFAIVGLFVGRMSRGDRALLVVVPLSTALLYAFFFTQTRYRIPVEPHLTLLAAAGLDRIATRLFGRESRS